MLSISDWMFTDAGQVMFVGSFRGVTEEHGNRYAVAGGTGAYANADGWIAETWDPELERSC